MPYHFCLEFFLMGSGNATSKLQKYKMNVYAVIALKNVSRGLRY